MVRATGKTQAQLDEQKAREEQERINNEARQYLRDTDWYVIREADTGEPMPQDVKDKRAEARGKIADI